MKLHERFRRVAPAARTRYRPASAQFAGHALPVATALALVLSALLAGGLFVTALSAVPTTVPTLLVGWVVAVGLTFALPLVVVRGVVAVVERLQ